MTCHNLLIRLAFDPRTVRLALEASGKCSSVKFQIHGAPSPRTTWRGALSKPRRSASRRMRRAKGAGSVSVSRVLNANFPRRAHDRAALKTITVDYTRPGVTVEGAVRALVAHEESGYEEWGASGSGLRR